MNKKANLSRIKKSLFLSMLISMCGLYLTIPVLAPLLREIGLSASKTGMIISCGGLFTFLTATMWGKFSNKIGRKRVIVTGLIGVAISYALFILVFREALIASISVGTSFVLILLTRSFMGVFMPATTSASYAYMADITTKEDRPAGMAIMGIAMGIAMVAGPAVGGGIGAYFGLLSPVYLTVILLLFGGLVNHFSMPDLRVKLSQEDARDAKKEPLLNYTLLSYLFLSFGCISTIIILQIITAFYLNDKFSQGHEESAKFLAVLLTISGFCLVFCQTLQISILKFRPKALMSSSAILMSLSLLTLLLANDARLMILAFALCGGATGMGMIGMNAGASLSVDKSRQGEVAGITGMNVALTNIVAPFIGPALYDVSPVLLFSSLLVYLLLAFCFFIFTKRL